MHAAKPNTSANSSNNDFMIRLKEREREREGRATKRKMKDERKRERGIEQQEGWLLDYMAERSWSNETRVLIIN